MKLAATLSALVMIVTPGATVGAPAMSLHDRTVNTIDGTPKAPSEYDGKVLVVVNTARQCGHTWQNAGLEALYKEYKDKGVVVLDFPSNDFGGQEPGTAEHGEPGWNFHKYVVG